MGKLWFLLTLSWSALAYSEPDVPVRGASYFDYLTNRAKITYDGRTLAKDIDPFQRLVTKLNQFSPLVSAVIPFGRSLQKMAAYPESLKFPRVLLATAEDKTKLNMPMQGRLFIGYVVPSKTLEVVSYNPVAARYEFQIVDNFYPGGKARTRYVPRKLCVRCHQGGVPIFAGGAWLESTGFNSELLRLTSEAVGGDSYLGIPLKRDGKSPDFDIVSQPERFDDMAHHGAMLIGYQRAFRQICAANSNPLACRKKLVQWMLLTNITNGMAPPPDRELTASFVQVLGSGTIDVAHHNFADHNPITAGKLSYKMPAAKDPSRPRQNLTMIMAAKDDPIGSQFYKFYVFVREMGAAVFTETDFEHLRRYLGSGLDRSKKLTLEALDALGSSPSNLPDRQDSCLVNTKHAYRLLNGKFGGEKIALRCFGSGMTQLITAVMTMNLKISDPLIRIPILKQLGSKLETKVWDQLCCSADVKSSTRSITPEKNYLDEAKISDPHLQNFFTYCAECHLHQDLPPPFLAAASENAIKQNLVKMRKLIRFRLKQNQMPPHFAQRPLGPKAKRLLLKSLEKLEK